MVSIIVAYCYLKIKCQFFSALYLPHIITKRLPVVLKLFKSFNAGCFQHFPVAGMCNIDKRFCTLT